ncbi:MAG: DUF5063 domain-containing protein [Pyrinomonadaceae bacterium]
MELIKAGDIDPAAVNFAELARRYCDWAEGELTDASEAMWEACVLLAELHVAALQLPDLGFGDAEAHEQDRVSQDDWRRVYEKFARLPVSSYYDVFHPLKEESPVSNSLNDDLADIYRDLKEGLALYDERRTVDAVWEWRFTFWIHWGKHLTSAQRAVHDFFLDNEES